MGQRTLEEQRRWLVDIAPLRKDLPAERHASKPPSCLLSYYPGANPYTPGYNPYSPAPPAPAVAASAAPRERREFVCGRYKSGEAATALEGPAHEPYKSSLGAVLWRAMFPGMSAAQACHGAYEALARDVACKQAQCRASASLAEFVNSKCHQVLGSRAEEVDGWLAEWKAQFDGDWSLCDRLLTSAVTSEDEARRYSRLCVKDREPSEVERLVLGLPAPEAEPTSGD